MAAGGPGAALTDTPPVVPDVETRFMANYRVDSPVSAGLTVEAVRNAAGDVELFTLGTDGRIWNFYPDPSSESGYRGVSTGVQASTFGVGRGPDGHIVLFASFRLQLSYVVEQPSVASRWSAPTQLAYSAPPGASTIARIVVDDIAGALYVGVLVEFSSAGNPLYSFVFSVWNPQNPEFQRTQMSVSSTNCAWLGSSAGTAAFACADVVIVAYSVSTAAVTRYPMAATFTSVSVDAATDAAGNPQILAVLGDGNAYHLIGGGAKPYSWAQISTGLTLRQIGAVTDATGNVHAFAVSGDNRLYHWQPDPSTPVGSLDGTPIFTAVAAMGLASDDGGDIDVFAIGTAHASLTHVFQEQQSRNWSSEAIEVPDQGRLDEYVSYTSDVSLHSAAGATLANAAVVISATEQTRITVNGQVFFVGPSHPARTSTNGAGLLSIAQETGGLAIPVLGLNVTGLMPAGQTLTIEQSAVVQARLAATTGQELMTARDATGAYVLADQYRTTATTDSLASAFQQCMALASSTSSATRPLAGLRRSNVGVGLLETGPLRVGRLPSPLVEQHWQLDFSSGGAAYAELTSAQAAAVLAEMRASTRSVAGVFDWLDDAGDFLAGVVDGAIHVLNTVVTTVVDGVKAAISCVIDGVTYLYEVVVDTIETAFDVVATFLAQVGVFFDKVFAWLGFLFDWPDMLRTHEALAYTLNEFLVFLQGAAAGTQKIIDDGIATLKAQITTVFDQAVAQIAGQSSLGGYDKANEVPGPRMMAATSNNPFVTGALNNAPAATSTATARPLLDSAADSLLSQLTAFADTTAETQAFSEVWDYMTNLGGSPDQIFTQLLSALLRLAEGVLEAILTGVQVVIDALLGAVQMIVAAIQTMLNEEWNIPVVSQLYSSIADGAALTTLDLVALMIAIPTTIVYKGEFDAAPFPTQASVAAFKQSFNAQSMLAAVGFPPSASEIGAGVEPAPRDGIVLPATSQRLLLVGSGVATAFYGAFTGVANAWPPPASPKILSKVNLVLESTSLVFGFPWFFSSSPPGCDTAEGKQAILWLYVSTGVMLDGFYVYQEGRITENTSDKGVIVAFVWGIGHLATAIFASLGQSGVPVATNILPTIPELSVPLRHTRVIVTTKGVSLPVLGGIDGLFYLVIGILIAITPTGQSETVDPTRPIEQEGTAMTELHAPRRPRTAAGRRLPPPDLPSNVPTFNGVYMRPNLQSTGTVPASGPLSSSPDIWIAGTRPVPNFQTALATQSSYATDPGNNVQEHADNYIYLRAVNGTSSPQTKTIQVYFAPSGVIQWPSYWEPNVLLTDQGNQSANIANLAPGAVGVGDQTFIWPNVPPPPAGSDHYCLIAQVNDAQNSNPAPSVDTVLDLGALIQSNLGFGWRNTNLVPGAQPSFEFSQNLTIPLNVPGIENYTISVAPVGWVGFHVSMTCSQADANGQPIVLTTTKIVQDGAGLAAPVCPLAPGFNASLNVVVTNPDGVRGPVAGAQVPLSCHYSPAARTAEAAEAVRRGLVDWAFMYSLCRADGGDPNIGPTVDVALGTYTWTIGLIRPRTKDQP